MIKSLINKPTVTAIIICAGEATRWANYMNVPKHFAPVDGEPILHRTIRLASKYTSTIYVVAKSQNYKIKNSQLFVPKLDTTNEDADKFLSSKDLWNLGGRTIVFYGDVFFTDDAMRQIFTHRKREWTLFAREHESKITGTPYGECFAQSFYPENIPEHLSNLNRIAYERREGIIDRCGGWEHYRAMADVDLKEHRINGRFYDIDDYTDDFDYPDDYDRFIKAWAKRSNKNKEK